MAWYQANIGGGSGNTTVQPVLIGNYTSATTSAVTRTLNQSIDNFKYVWFSLYPITSDSVWLNDTTATSQAGYAFCDVEYFKTHPVTLAYSTGNSGSATFRTAVITYVDGTTITSQFNNSGSRYFYVYGIKDMPHGHWNETVLWTNSAPTSTFAAQSVTVDAITNYDYIKITARFSTSDTATRQFILSPSEFKLEADGTIAIGFRQASSTGSTRARAVFLTDSSYTKISFASCYGLTTSSQTAANNYIIPISIAGIKT